MKSLDFLHSVGSLFIGKRMHFVHRDLSWIQFNERVLRESQREENPLLERVKFLAISASNLDEFFMIRVSSLFRSVKRHRKSLDLIEAQRLGRVQEHLLESLSILNRSQEQILSVLKTELESSHIYIHTELEPKTPSYLAAKKIFEKEILPLLPSPETFSLASLSKLENLQSGISLPQDLWIRIPRTLPLLFLHKSENGKRMDFFFLDHLLTTFLSPKFPGNAAGPVVFRITRDGDYPYELDQTDPESIPDVVRTRLRDREKGVPIRLQYFGNPSVDFLREAAKELKLEEGQLHGAPGTLYLHSLWGVFHQVPTDFGKGLLRHRPLAPCIPEPFTKDAKLFDRLKERDYLLHHPYDAFDSYVQLVRTAVQDPQVVQIEQTVYRMDALSPVIDLLKEAAKKKKVRVLIELRARFDELNNLRLADELNKAGVEIFYGFGKLKLHAKVALFTRNEGGNLVHYTHLSTGNYNASTARTYTDLAIISAHPDLGNDARHFFDRLMAGEVPTQFKQIVTAPTGLARKIRSLIQNETEAATQGKPARIFAKVNALVDEGIIESLYQASQAGVKVDLVVRGACSLIPGLPGISENIRVISIVDRFLEHSRIYYFENAGKMYLSSADWMPRNLFNRLEIAFPVLDPKVYKYLKETVLPTYLNDTARAQELNYQGRWISRENKSPKKLRSQTYFEELATNQYRDTPLA